MVPLPALAAWPPSFTNHRRFVRLQMPQAPRSGTRPPDHLPGNIKEIACYRLRDGHPWEPGLLHNVDGAWHWDAHALTPEEAPPRMARALWTPPLLDAHTHLGDAFLRPERDRLPRDLQTLVAPPDGYKHRRLAEVDPDEQRDAIATRLEAMSTAGTGTVIDFREGGAHGLGVLEEAQAMAALRGHHPETRMLARPGANANNEPDAWIDELDGLLARAAGVGLSGLGDLPARCTEHAADSCQDANKPLALHLSEARHEPMETALTLEPSLLVHLVHAKRRELIQMAEDHVLAVTCPSSNRFFHAAPPLALLHELSCDHGLRVAFGTDNAMLSDGDVREEATHLASQVKHATVDWTIRALAGAAPANERPRDLRAFHLIDHAPSSGLLWGIDPRAPIAEPTTITLERGGRWLLSPLYGAPARVDA